MSDKHTLTATFEISIEDNKLLIDYRERENTISEKVQYSVDMFPIEIDIKYLFEEHDSEDKRKKYIHEEIDCIVLNQIANLLSHAGSKMLSEYKQNE